MSATSAHGGSRKPPTSLFAALNRMQWDSVIAIVVASDPYYHYDPTRGTREKQADKNTDATATAPKDAEPQQQQQQQQQHWFRRYLISSSGLRLAIHAGSVCYLVYVLTHPSQYVPCTVIVAPAATAAANATGAGVVQSTAAPITTDCYIYQGAEGMQLLMRGKMPRWAVLLHAVAGTLLLPLGLTQKESVWYMQYAKKTVVESTTVIAAGGGGTTIASHARVEEVRMGDAQAHSAAKKVHLRRARVSRRHHGNCGFMTGCSVFMMVAGGVSLRTYSVFSEAHVSTRAGLLNFASAMFLFAAPWVLLTPATVGSGTNSKAVAHAMLGNLLVKAILAVPFERVLGGLWQRAAGVRVVLPRRRWWPAGVVHDDVRVEVTQQVEGALERVYYKSIVATTVIFGIWGVVDIVRFVRLAKKCLAADERAKTSE